MSKELTPEDRTWLANEKAKGRAPKVHKDARVPEDVWKKFEKEFFEQHGITPYEYAEREYVERRKGKVFPNDTLPNGEKRANKDV